MPCLATIVVSFSADGTALRLRAPGMPELAVPTAAKRYAGQEDLVVECSGKSTSRAEGGWSFGFIDCKSAGAAASEWISSYLNALVETGKASDPRAVWDWVLVSK